MCLCMCIEREIYIAAFLLRFREVILQLKKERRRRTRKRRRGERDGEEVEEDKEEERKKTSKPLMWSSFEIRGSVFTEHLL